MTKITQGERLAIIETKLETLNSDISEIKAMLKDHTEWESKKYEELKRDTAGKWVETVTIGIIIAVTSAVVGAVIYVI